MRQLLFLSIFIGQMFSLNAADWQWAYSNGNYDDHTFPFFSETDADGNLYVAGHYYGSSLEFELIHEQPSRTVTLTNYGRCEIFVVKFNLDGEPLWAKSFGGTKDDHVFGFIVADDNTLYLAGGYESSDFKVNQSTTLKNSGEHDGFYLHLDANGEYLDHFEMNGIGREEILKITLDSNGDLIIGGTFTSSTYSFGSHTITNINSGTPDYFIAKRNASTWQWALSNGSSGYDKFQGLILDDKDNIYTTVVITDSIDFRGERLYSSYSEYNGNKYYQSSTVCLKYDSDGNGESYYQNKSIMQPEDLYLNINGDIVMSYQEMPMIVIGTAYPTSGIIVLDANMAEKAMFSYQTQLSHVDFDANANMYVTSYSNHHFPDIKVEKFNSNYQILGEKIIESDNSDNIYAIKVIAEDQFYITGAHSSNTIDFDSYKLANTNSVDEVYFHLVGVFNIPKKNMFVAKTTTDFKWDTSTSSFIKADFSSELVSGTEIKFTNTSSSLSNYIWEFGDGTTSKDESPSHIYSQTGLYTVCLTGEAGFGSNGSTSHSVCKDVLVSDGSLVSQTIDLKAGWNLISFNVEPSESAIDSVFEPIYSLIEVVKNNDGFFKSDYESVFHSIENIEGGEAYLIKMKTDASLVVYGELIDLNIYSKQLKAGWNLLGVPFQGSKDLELVFQAIETDVEVVKHFDGFYKTGFGQNTISELKAGKGYYIKLGDDRILSF